MRNVFIRDCNVDRLAKIRGGGHSLEGRASAAAGEATQAVTGPWLGPTAEAVTTQG